MSPFTGKEAGAPTKVARCLRPTGFLGTGIHKSKGSMVPSLLLMPERTVWKSRAGIIGIMGCDIGADEP